MKNSSRANSSITAAIGTKFLIKVPYFLYDSRSNMVGLFVIPWRTPEQGQTTSLRRNGGILLTIRLSYIGFLKGCLHWRAARRRSAGKEAHSSRQSSKNRGLLHPKDHGERLAIGHSPCLGKKAVGEGLCFSMTAASGHPHGWLQTQKETPG